MVKKLLTLVFVASAIMCSAQSKPTREVVMPTEKAQTSDLKDYFNIERGFYGSVDFNGGILFGPSHYGSVGFTEIDIIGGYRFSEYIRVGLGLGARLHIDPNHHRYMTHKWAMPIFLDARGNFIPTGYRTVVPFWSFNIGGSCPDGFMIRPSVGFRIGQKRSAFLVSIGYIGQQVRSIDPEVLGGIEKTHPIFSGLNITLGYEY